MKISVVTTCFNAAPTIERTIESILGQQGNFELEYLVTDAGSTDGTLDIIARYGDRIRSVEARGLNQSAGINRGLQASTGDIVAFLNGDDVYAPGALEDVARRFTGEPDRLWLIGECDIIDEFDQVQTSWISWYKNLLLHRYSYLTLLTENYVCQPAVFLRRAALERYGFFSEDENLVMDYEYWLRIGKENRPIVVPKRLASFRRMSTTKSNSRFLQMFEDDLRVALRYARQHGLGFISPLKYLMYLKTIGIYRFLYGSGGR